MVITFDPAKRQATLRERGLDFLDAAEVLAGITASMVDARRDYGEVRTITAGYLRSLRGACLDPARRGDPRHLHEARS